MPRMKIKMSSYKRFALQAAKDLEYGEDVIAKIWASDNDIEISQIMNQARANGGKLASGK